MALSKLVFKPGINRDQTNYSSEGGWFSMDKVRFRSGFPEKIGGWTVRNLASFAGTARSLFSWNTSDGAQLVSIGTNEKIYVMPGTTLYDITPIRVTFISPDTDNCLSTVNGSNIVTVTIIANGVEENDYVTLSGVVGPVGGIPATELNAEFQVFNVTGSTFDIEVTTNATSTVAAGGGTSIVVACQIHTGAVNTVSGYGWGAGAWSRGSWGSGSSVPLYDPARLIFQDKFNNSLIFNIYRSEIYFWEYDPLYLSRAVYLRDIPGAIAVPEEVNKIMFNAQGYLLALGCNTYLPTEVAGVAIATITHVTTVATVTTSTDHGLSTGQWITLSGQVPTDYSGHYQITVTSNNTFEYTMVTDPGISASTVGTYIVNNYLGSYDPMLIRWCNVSADLGPDPLNWQPTLTNTAGFLRVQNGSGIVSGISTRQETLIFTDLSISSLQFLGTAEIFGLQELSHNITIMGPNVVVGSNNITYWMGIDRFYAYSGRVDTLPCTLRQYIFSDINLQQRDIFFAGINSNFGEIIWFYCSSASTSINKYVIYNYLENIWYYGTLDRTAWLDTSVITNPLATQGGWVYNQEVGTDDGQPMGASPLPMEAHIQSADVDIEDGDKFMLVRRVIPDINFNGSETSNPVTGDPLTPEATITVGVRNFPGALSSTINAEGVPTDRDIITSVTIDQYTNQVFVRARGRQMNFKIESNTLGTQWQLGMPRVDARPDGLRG